MKKVIVVFAIALGVYRLAPIVLNTVSSANSSSEVVNRREGPTISNTQADYSEFSCDGRQYCSQMTSRTEAEFFVRYCPDTKMDGDNDGVPCENDSRW